MTEADIGLDLDLLRRNLVGGRSVDLPLPDGGRLYVDRPLPFVCLYRMGEDDESARLVTTQPSYLVASCDRSGFGPLADVLAVLTDSMVDRFGRFLLLEIWTRAHEKVSADPYDLQPEFRIHAPESDPLASTVTALAKGLKRIAIQQFVTQVQVNCTECPAPPGLPSVTEVLTDDRSATIGLEVEPVYCRPKRGGVYPFLFDVLRAQMCDALRKGFFAYARDASGFAAPGYMALGRRAFETAVREVDHGLAEIGESYDFLLQTTPINAEEAWSDFQGADCATEPVFRYRPLPVDPSMLKRRLFALPIEKVDDPTLRWIFREKQEEIDRQLTMLGDRDSRQFFFQSLQLYGEVSGSLLDEARELLRHLPAHDYDLESTEHLDAEAFAEVAVSDLLHYKQSCPDFPETVHIRRDMPPGLMVSRGRLLIGHRTKIPAARVESLLHHEVGTHMLTYFNGRVQPLRLLYNGLAGYESLQEGLAVLAEYLVGGLNVPRLRVLAARVVAAHCMIEGSSFTDLYRLLRRDYGFEPNEAFSISLRTFRGGGLIKDVIYLRGLHEIMHYLRAGGELNVLFTGKMALRHLPVLEELRERGILNEAPLKPRYLDDERAAARLKGVREGSTFINLIEHRPA